MNLTEHMQHGSRETWEAYVRGAIPEPERDSLERHLEMCGECLQLYLEALEGLELPPMPQPKLDEMADWVVGMLTEQERRGVPMPVAGEAASRPKVALVPGMSPTAAQAGQQTATSAAAGERRGQAARGPDVRRRGQERSRRGWLSHPAAPYAIAAAITMLLIGTGAMGGMANRFAELDAAANPIVRPAEPSGSGSGAETDVTARGSWSQSMMNKTVSWLDALQTTRFR